MERDFWKIAAQIASPDPNPDPQLLNADFGRFLVGIHGNCLSAGGDLISRQVIALAIETWKAMNPDKKIYGD